jgi:hypothetical protein
MTAALIFIALGVMLFLLAVVVQTIALAKGAARGDAMLRRAAALERHRAVIDRQQSRRRIAA